MVYATQICPVGIEDGLLDWTTINRLRSLRPGAIQSFSRLRMDFSSPLARYPSGILTIDMNQAQPVIGKRAAVTCSLLQAGKYSTPEITGETALEDIVAVIDAVFRSSERLRTSVARIHDLAKAIYHLRPGFARLGEQDRKSELQRLLELA